MSGGHEAAQGPGGRPDKDQRDHNAGSQAGILHRNVLLSFREAAKKVFFCRGFKKGWGPAIKEK